jgi:hypothetical protein
MDTKPFSGGKRQRRGVDHPPPYSAEVKKRVELYQSQLCKEEINYFSHYSSGKSGQPVIAIGRTCSTDNVGEGEGGREILYEF